MSSSAILEYVPNRSVQGSAAVAGGGTQTVQMPQLPLYGSFAIKGRFQANPGDGSAQTQSVEVDITGTMNNGQMTYTAGAQVLLPGSLAAPFIGLSVAFTGSGTATQTPAFTLNNGTVQTFWSWNLQVDRLTTSGAPPAP